MINPIYEVPPNTKGRFNAGPDFIGGDNLFDVYIRKVNGQERNYRNVRNVSITPSRIIICFQDESMIRVNPGEVEELKLLSNVRRMIEWDG